VGVEIKQFYLTALDSVPSTFCYANDDNIAIFALALSSHGNGHISTLRVKERAQICAERKASVRSGGVRS
jgi:hypothetical protein